MEFIEVKGKTVDDAITEALIQLGVPSDQIEYEVVDEGKKGLLGFNSRPAVLKVWKKNNTEDNVRDFLNQVFKAMNMEVEIKVEINEVESLVNVDLKEIGRAHV